MDVTVSLCYLFSPRIFLNNYKDRISPLCCDDFDCGWHRCGLVLCAWTMIELWSCSLFSPWILLNYAHSSLFPVVSATASLLCLCMAIGQVVVLPSASFLDPLMLQVYSQCLHLLDCRGFFSCFVAAPLFMACEWAIVSTRVHRRWFQPPPLVVVQLLSCCNFVCWMT